MILRNYRRPAMDNSTFNDFSYSEQEKLTNVQLEMKNSTRNLTKKYILYMSCTNEKKQQEILTEMNALQFKIQLLYRVLTSLN